MPSTSFFDPTSGFKAWALQDRTDTSGSSVDDAGGEDARLILEAFTPGVLSADAFRVVEDSPSPGMTVVVGSGSAKSDVAVIQGSDAGQGKYAVRSDDAETDVTIAAADATNPRIDEIYLVVQDNTYDSSGNVVPRIGYRQGDAAGSPSAPGPDSNWDAYLLIASVAVGNGVTSIEDADITDERVFATAETAGGGFVPTGGVIPFAGASAPDGWLLCQGQAVSRSTFSRLFAVVGTTYGNGNGSTTFNLPDARQRFPLGKAASGTGSTLGSTGGAINHTHSNPTTGNNNNPVKVAFGDGPDVAQSPHTHPQGNTGAANPPFIVFNYAIKT